MTQHQLPQGTPLHDGEIAAATEGFKTAEATRTVRSGCVCLFICNTYTITAHSIQIQNVTESRDPPPLCTILEVICAGVGWVWEGDYMSITRHCTSGEESIVTATVPVNLLPSQGSLVPSQGSLVPSHGSLVPSQGSLAGSFTR